MGYYVAFPSNLIDELLGNLPEDMRPRFSECFEPVVADLVWTAEDAENAVEHALQQYDHPLADIWKDEPDLKRGLTVKLLDYQNDELVGMVQLELETMASDVIREYICSFVQISAPSDSPDT